MMSSPEKPSILSPLRAAVEHVVAGEQRDLAGRCAGVADQNVAAGAAFDPVVAFVADQLVVVFAADDDVVAGAALDSSPIDAADRRRS